MARPLRVLAMRVEEAYNSLFRLYLAEHAVIFRSLKRSWLEGEVQKVLSQIPRTPITLDQVLSALVKTGVRGGNYLLLRIKALRASALEQRESQRMVRQAGVSLAEGNDRDDHVLLRESGARGDRCHTWSGEGLGEQMHTKAVLQL